MIGQGGFGITYEARHTLLEKEIAIKEFFPKEYCDREERTNRVTLGTKNSAEMVDKLRAKFIKEAKNIAKLSYPGIVKGYDVFEENNTAYFVMDYIKGKSLSQIVKEQGQLSLSEAVKYVTQVSGSLSYLHAQGMNHLDVKPANIMIREEDGHAVLIDFGLAKQYDASGGQTSTTPVGISHGYAPPEQYKAGGVSKFSPQTDIYALGATLYKLITGNTPADALELMEDSLPFPGSVPPNVRSAIEKAMSPMRKNRYQRVEDFIAAINPTGKVKSEATVIDTPKPKPAPKPQPVKPTPTPTPQPPKPAPVETKKSRKIAKWLVIGIGVIVVYGFVAMLADTYGWFRSDQDVIAYDTVAVVDEEMVVVPDTGIAAEPAEYGAPLSEGEVVSERGGFDDNAEGYFQMHADEYMTQNRDVYFDGSFSDGGGSYPINLKFEFDDNYFPGVCYYTNINYDTKLKMSVRFTEEEMIIKGNAGGSEFVMRFHPTSDGKWAGTAVNGRHNLSATIHPVKF